MKFERITNIAVQTTELQQAKAFYTNILGFPNRINEPVFEGIDANPIRMFVQKDSKLSDIVMELMLDNLEEAKKNTGRQRLQPELFPPL